MPIAGIGLSPDEIVRGRPSRSPADNSAPFLSAPSFDNPVDFAQFLVSILHRYHAHVRRQQLRLASDRAANHKADHVLLSIAVGDLVVVYDPRPRGADHSSAFASDWTGPFRVVKILSDSGVYALAHARSGRTIERHQDQILPYRVIEEVARSLPAGEFDVPLPPATALVRPESPQPASRPSPPLLADPQPLPSPSRSAPPSSPVEVPVPVPATASQPFAVLTDPNGDLPVGTALAVRDPADKRNFHFAVSTGVPDADAEVPVQFYGNSARTTLPLYTRSWFPAWFALDARGRARTVYALTVPTPESSPYLARVPRADVFAYGFSISGGSISRSAMTAIRAAFAAR
jgi:hypothetical protein